MGTSEGKTRVGWIGTGVMGRSMCGHLIDAGYSVTVYNRTRGARGAPARARRDLGRHARARSPAASDVVFSIVGFPADVREVILGEDGALGRRGRRAACSST